MLDWQRCEHRRVGYDGGWLLKRADEVFSRCGVDAGLTTHRCVDHREESRWYLNVRHAAHERRRDETGEIADHAAAECDHCRVATELGRKHFIGQPGPRLSRLLRFA